MTTYTRTVTINGTSEETSFPGGLPYNPFPKIAKREYDRLELQLNKLNSRPLPTEEDLRAFMKELGFPAEWRDAVADFYEPGARSMFRLTIDDSDGSFTLDEA